jgi:hypothetical protein
MLYLFNKIKTDENRLYLGLQSRYNTFSKKWYDKGNEFPFVILSVCNTFENEKDPALLGAYHES